MKILANVFLSTNNNNLILADVIFNDKIQAVVKVADLTWKDISNKESRSFFRKSILQRKYAETDSVIDGDFLLAIPGAIDSHVHFDSPGYEFREDFEHASTAAAFGGVTTIIDMPCTSIPPVTNKNNFKIKLQNIQNRSLIDFGFWGGICRQDFENKNQLKKNIAELAEAGVAGFKVYTISGMTNFGDLSYEMIEHAARIVEKYNKPLAVHAEDKLIVTTEMEKSIKAGKNNWSDYTAARNIEAEVLAVKKLINIAERTNAKILIVHLSSGEGIKLIADARKRGVEIFAETCPHYLFFTQKDFDDIRIRNFLKTAPPVKFESDKNSLWKALKKNEILFVNTDHAGCNPNEEKVSQNFWEVYGGIPGVEHRVPFLFSEGFLKNKISLEQTIDYLSTNAADFFNINSKGKIEKGKDADITLINLWSYQTITSKNMHSKGKYTPFEGIVFSAVVEKTFLRGEFILDGNNKRGTVGFGRFIQSEK